MFGYVTVCEPELKVKDLKKYRAYYCGLCRTLKEDYGFMGQMTLTPHRGRVKDFGVGYLRLALVVIL